MWGGIFAGSAQILEELLNYWQVGMLIFQISLIGYMEIEIRNLLHY